MENDRYRVILNPKAGKGRALGKMDEIRSRFLNAGVDFEIILTEGVGHATELAFEAGGAGWNVVVAAGGDGTCNEIVNGLMRYSDQGKAPPVLGVLAVGRGNDFACGADIPKVLEAGLDCIFHDRRRPLDVGLVRGGAYPQGRYFCNGVGVGFDTIVGLEAAKLKYFHGSMAYIAGALRAFIKYPRTPVLTLSYDDKSISCRSTQLNIMNGRRLGGVYWMAPNGKNYDGLFDLCMIKARLSRPVFVDIIIRYTKGTQASHPLILTALAKRFAVDSPEGGLAVHADGETICENGKRVEVEVLPSRLAIICHCGPE